MDEIQKVLVEAGRKDLAQEYYNKVSVKTRSGKDLTDDDVKTVGVLFAALNDNMKKYQPHIDKIDKAYTKDNHDYIRNQWGMITTLARELVGKVNSFDKAFNKI